MGAVSQMNGDRLLSNEASTPDVDAIDDLFTCALHRASGQMVNDLLGLKLTLKRRLAAVAPEQQPTMAADILENQMALVRAAIAATRTE